MTERKGIDVSAWQRIIDWEKVKPQIDFAMLRAGCGTDVDNMFEYNASECTRLAIPFGVYWFSYAYTTDMAKKEAELVCQCIEGYKLSYPVCFDFEYDSSNYAKKNGVEPTPQLITDLAKTFLNYVESRGYYAMNYTNLDYLNKGFSALTKRYDTWLACWTDKKPNKPCGIWQRSSTGFIDGIRGNVDLDIAYKDYPVIIANMHKDDEPNNEKEEEDKEDKKHQELEILKEKEWGIYYQLAIEVIQGKWGNGSERRIALQKAGFDYNYVQSIVDILI